MLARPFLIHALSPLHAGTGQSVGVIDLPIARMRSTGIPLLPGSSVKGVLRDALRSIGADPKRIRAVFGPNTLEASAHAGALIVTDARLLALPVRSFAGTFAWVSSPLLLSLAVRDPELRSVLDHQIPTAGATTALVASIGGENKCVNVVGGGEGAKVYLEDLDLPVTADQCCAAWGAALAPLVGGAEHPEMFERRFVIVDDETMTFLWETATQVDTRVRIDAETRTVADKALWTEESLPPESLLVGCLVADRSRWRDQRMTPDEVIAFVLDDERMLQFGGKATVGRGRCRMIPLGIQAAPVGEEAGA